MDREGGVGIEAMDCGDSIFCCPVGGVDRKFI